MVAVLKIKRPIDNPLGSREKQREIEGGRDGGGSEGRKEGLKYSATALIVGHNNNKRHLANMCNNNKKETSPLANGFEVSVYAQLIDVRERNNDVSVNASYLAFTSVNASLT